MKAFPISTANAVYISRFSCFSQKAVLPKFQWGQKLYMQYAGALRAVKPIFAAYVYYNIKEDHPGLKTMVCFDIAGIGKKNIQWDVYVDDHRRVKPSSWNSRIFRSKDEYERYINGENVPEFVPEAVYVTDILRVHGYSRFEETNVWDYKIIGWCWNYGEPRECPMSFKDLWIDEDGAHITVIHQGWGKPEYPAYITREECLAANRKKFVEFDEPEPISAGVMDDTNGHDPELVERINEAWDTEQNWWELTLILSALMHRDGSQILEELGKEITEYADEEKMVLELAPEYLQHIADDQDLQQILDFIGR